MRDVRAASILIAQDHYTFRRSQDEKGEKGIRSAWHFLLRYRWHAKQIDSKALLWYMFHNSRDLLL